MREFLQISGVVSGDRDAATARVRDAFDRAGAWITDVRFFSGVQTVLSFEVAPERLRALETALGESGVELDSASRAAIAAVETAKSDVPGTLALMFVHGDPDLKHEIPAVPG